MNIEKREIAWKGLTLRSADDSGTSTVEGVAVPFGDIIDTWDGAETFDRECEFQGLDEAKLCYEHGETIGRITKAESTDDGLHITARISDTARGRDAMTLIRDGVLDSFSVGFIPLESQKDRDGITHRRKVRLLETSIVSWPAYQNAKMTKSAAPAVQQRKETMENNNELMDLIQSMQEEQRGIKAEISKMGAKPAPAAIGAAYRSHGEYMQALARGDEQAMTVMKECRELISTKDTGNTATWIADDLKLIEERRKVSQLLTHDTLPATGMSMEYHVVTSDTTAVGKQETEGSELPSEKSPSAPRQPTSTPTAATPPYPARPSNGQPLRCSTPRSPHCRTPTRRPPRRQSATTCTRRSRISATHHLTPTRSTRHSWPT